MNLKFNELNKTLLLLFLTSLLLLSPTAACGQGCLSCSPTTCLLCDTFNHYALTAATCTLITNQPNCSLTDHKGNCVTCSAGHHIDAATLRCALVAPDRAIEHCQHYNPDRSCFLCETGMVTVDGSCAETNSPVKNCLYQLDDVFCVECEAGYVESLDRKSCIAVEAVGGCGGYSLVGCEQCGSGTVLNRNSYLLRVKGVVERGEAAEGLLVGIGRELSNELAGYNGGVCKAATVTNCARLAAYDECTVCNDGYYLTEDNNCEIFPDDIIANCQIYYTLSLCYSCTNNFHIGPEDDCTPVEEIEGCVQYNGAKKKTECLLCLDEMFLMSEVECKPRVFEIIPGCIDYTVNADTCSHCETGAVLTSDLVACKTELDNCLDYEVSTQNDDKLRCAKCRPGFYVDQELCIQGTVDFCDTYEDESDDCKRCKFQYFLKAPRECEKHASFLDCSVYSQTEKDVCEQCGNKHIGFNVTNRCAPATAIPGCVVLSNATDCDRCADGYIHKDLSCEALPSTMNCLKATDAETCTQCKEGFLLHGSSCQVAPGFLTAECSEANTDDGEHTIENGRCDKCRKGTVAWNFKDNYLCYEDNWLALLADAAIPHCLQVSLSEGTATCARCRDGHFLENNTCIQNCTLDYILTHSLTEVDSGFFLLTGGRECQAGAPTGAVTNCEVYSYGNAVAHPNKDLICVKCKTGFGKVVDVTSTESTPMEGGDSLADLAWEVTSPVAFFPKVTKCLDVRNSSSETVHFSEIGEHRIEGCEYYAADGGSYYCLRCQTGKRGVLGHVASGDYIAACETTLCSSALHVGLDVIQNSLVSCYKCTDPNSIPFLFVKGGAAYTDVGDFKAYDLHAADKDYDTAADGGYTVNCHKRSGSDFTISSFNLPSKCSIGVYNVETSTAVASSASSTGIDDTSKLAVFCMACEGGYRRRPMTKTGGPVKHAVYECEQIDNCADTSWFNYCGECNENFAFLYTDNGVDYTQCISFEKDPLCHAADKAETGVCRVCKKGLRTNKDGFCEQLADPGCLEGKGSPRTKMANADFGTLMFLNRHGPGCLECKENYTAVLVEVDVGVCVESEYAAKAAGYATTNYIKNCEGYYLDNADLKCRSCSAEYVLAEDHTLCFANHDLDDCLLATTDKDCSICVDGYIGIAKKCQKKKIANCKTYVENATLTEQLCIVCEDGYFMNGGKCPKGTIDFCATFTNGGAKCARCATGYQKVDAGGSDFCFLLPKGASCQDFDETKFQNNELHCSQCKSAIPLYIEADLGEEKNFLCLPFTEKQHCLEYSNKHFIRDSTLRCVSCADGYFVDSSGSCAARAKTSNGCTSYTVDADKCSQCADGYFLDREQDNCATNPVGIAGCRVYLAAAVCLKCRAGMYLSAANCLSVPLANIITNCEFYKNDEVCEDCQHGYALLDNACKKGDAKNCLRWEDVDTCESCPAGRGLQKIETRTNCVENKDKFCLDFVPVFPFKCKLCKSGYYAQEAGNCAKVAKGVGNCAVYLNSSQCDKCEEGYVLSIDKDFCFNGTDYRPYIVDGCVRLVEFAAPVCSVCKGGSVFGEDGGCVGLCGDGCFWCDPENVEVCLVCSSGSYMKEKGVCVADEPETGGPLVEAEWRRNIRILLIVVVLWVNN